MRTRHAVAILSVASLAFAWVMLEAAAQQAPVGAPGAAGGRAGGGAGRGGPQPAVGSMPTRRFEQIAGGVYLTSSTGSMSVGSNSCVIVNDQDVLIVDPGEAPATARAFIEDVKTITNKPVRYVVDSHYHFDHAHGNQIFGPDVTVIGHDRTYDMLAGNPLKGQAYYTQASPDLLQSRLDALKAQPAPTDPQQLATQQRQIAALALRITQEKEIKPTPPTTTFSQSMTLHRGGREIQIWYFGRAHTDTDIVVFLPQQKIACTGDMLEPGMSYLPDGWVNEWPDTVQKLAALDFEIALPGHGAAFKAPKDKIRAYQVYLRELYKQVMALRAQGLSVQETAQKVDLTSLAADWPNLRAGADLRGVQRMYDLAANPNAPLRSVGSVDYPSK